jgi:ubiquinol-cytochrome c reductase cytochrome c subunit
VLALAALLLALVPDAAAQAPQGRDLYARDCVGCHGPDASGVPLGGPVTTARNAAAGGPSLHGVGAASADLYLSLGYMPLRDARDRPTRHAPIYTQAEIDALVEYVASLPGGGPGIPDVDPARGDLALGQRLFTQSCAGCHQSLGEGGVVAGGTVAPKLDRATALQVAEAIRVGPNVMPRFSERALDRHDVDSIAAYVLYAQRPKDGGGWPLGHVGPVAEGAVAWLAAAVVLVLLARALGRKTT